MSDTFQTAFVQALLIPTTGAPQHIQVQVAPNLTPEMKQRILDDEDLQDNYVDVVASNTVQNAAFAILASHTRANSRYRRVLSDTREPSDFEGAPLPDSVNFAFITDSAFIENHEVIFFNGDNGHPVGISMMLDLTVNRNLAPIRGPVLVLKSDWIEWKGMDSRKFEDIGDFTEELKEQVVSGIKRRYRDAGVLRIGNSV